MKKNKKQRKKLINLSDNQKKIIFIIALVLFLLLLIRYEKNKWFIKYYRTGSMYYSINEYDMAESYFGSALYEHPKGKKDCKTRINKALSIVKQYPVESVTKENRKEVIDRLNEAKDYLTENGCASDSGNGHNKNAQTLKEEIDEYINELMKQEEQDTTEEESNDDNKDNQNQQQDNSEENEEQDAKFEEIKKQLEESETLGQEERIQNQELYESWGNYSSDLFERNW